MWLRLTLARRAISPRRLGAADLTARLLTALAVIFALSVLAPSPLWAQERDAPDVEAQIERFDRVSNAIDEVLEEETRDADQLERLRATAEEIRIEARAGSLRLSEALEPLQAQLAALGERPEIVRPEDREVELKRSELSQRIGVLEARLKSMDLAVARAEAQSKRISARQRDYFSRTVFARSPSPLLWETWATVATETPAALSRVWVSVGEGVADVPRTAETVLVALGLILGGWLILAARGPVRGAIEGVVARAAETESDLTRIACGFALLGLRVGPPVLLALAAAEALIAPGVAGEKGARLIWLSIEALALGLVAVAAARTLFAPNNPPLRVLDLGGRRAARVACARVAALALILGLGRIAAGAALEYEAPDALRSLLGLAVALAAAAPVAGLTAALARPSAARMRAAEATSAASSDGASEGDDAEAPESDPFGPFFFGARMLGYGLAIAAPGAAAFGYVALARFALERAALSAVLVAIACLLFVAVRRATRAGRRAGEVGRTTAPGGSSELGARAFAPALTGLSLAILVAPALAYVWGATATDIRTVALRIVEGVRIGEVVYAPGDLLAAALVLIVGVWITRILQRMLRRTLLENSRVDAGVRTSLSTGLGYAGVFLTALVAISAAGLSLANLALVVGALSVGIGFGLQNIVNNFVSGLILLIERPIKPGDWIVVGGNEGYVRHINVRSTEIETFDRSTVIVPNSDLIANQVMNWTHRSVVGRVIARVHVAHGTDAERVMALLTEIATAHPMGLRYPQPFIYFSGFAESAMTFEIRLFIRDINNMLSVRSELHMAIHQRFREEGIEIPVPQRDVRFSPLVSGAAPARGDEDAPDVAVLPAPGTSATAAFGPRREIGTAGPAGEGDGDGGGAPDR